MYRFSLLCFCIVVGFCWWYFYLPMLHDSPVPKGRIVLPEDAKIVFYYHQSTNEILRSDKISIRSVCGSNYISNSFDISLDSTNNCTINDGHRIKLKDCFGISMVRCSNLELTGVNNEHFENIHNKTITQHSTGIKIVDK